MDDYICMAGCCAAWYLLFGGDRNRARAPPRAHNPHMCPHCDQYGRCRANVHGRPHASPYSPHADAQCGAYGPTPGCGQGRPYAPSAAAYNAAPPGVQFPPEYHGPTPGGYPGGPPAAPGYPVHPSGPVPGPMPPAGGHAYPQPYIVQATPPPGYPTTHNQV
ncbi:hypothetical protein HOP50_04g35380 [Chloropicon primus]|uniref:Uncharacterized protein n=1 Tax=Chloropicon primus TaxID=1764295 RepID=A0A5B8MKN3_9CHLO|nr:hypothetical protein A3770_04p35310 [Chloropicon primus]UPR00224.1 hypothetical protein HOP50_04g35380 [Chloropicon primus]|eukprot:QDZ21013.1 hypothetical protein A3770_04p35310 [Chloropicon primus]